MAHDVFVSHSAKDAEVAAAIVARLEAESIHCWVAPRDVVPGADWGESIIDAIESSRIMILVFSRNANDSRQVKREVERADRKGIYTIPFRIDDVEPTKSLAYFISTAHWMDAFQPSLKRHLDTLAKTVAAILSGSPPPPPPPPPPPAIPKIAGVWRDSGYPGNVSQITQDDNGFTFTKRGTAPNGTPFEASGSGTISGLQIESRYDATWYPPFQIPIRSWAKCSGSVSADGMHMKLTCEDSRFGVFSGEANRE
jgi:hypothetical protein